MSGDTLGQTYKMIMQYMFSTKYNTGREADWYIVSFGLFVQFVIKKENMNRKPRAMHSFLFVFIFSYYM